MPDTSVHHVQPVHGAAGLVALSSSLALDLLLPEQRGLGHRDAFANHRKSDVWSSARMTSRSLVSP